MNQRTCSGAAYWLVLYGLLNLHSYRTYKRKQHGWPQQQSPGPSSPSTPLTMYGNALHFGCNPMLQKNFPPWVPFFSGDHSLCHVDINLASKTTEIYNTSFKVVRRKWSLQKSTRRMIPVCKFKEPSFEFEVSVCPIH